MANSQLAVKDEPSEYIALCDDHGDQLRRGVVDIPWLKRAKDDTDGQLLVSDQQLATRREFVDALLSEIETSPNSYRSYVSGPYFLAPDWAQRRRDGRSSTPNFDARVSERISRITGRDHNTRFILSLSNRFREKVLRLVDNTEELDRYKKDLLERIAQVWGGAGEKGPDLACINLGTYQIDYVFDKALLSQTRVRPAVATAGGWLYKDQALVRRARARFDEVLDSNFRGIEAELETLRSYIERM